MNIKQFEKAVLAAATDLCGREEELCKLDSFVGDGDHGMSLKKGFSNVVTMINSEEALNFHDFLFNVAMAFSEKAGGAIGPILASLFLGMSDAVSVDKTELSVTDMADLLKSGTERIQTLGGALPGESTLVDTLIPAYTSLGENSQDEMCVALGKMVESAYAGAMSTKDMAAKKGRARYLDDKSIGYIDAGAMSMYYFLKAFTESIQSSAC